MALDAKPTVDYKELFRSLSSAFIVFGIDDPNFTIIEENEAHATIAMVQRKNVVGKPLFDVFPDTSEQYVKTGKSQLLESIRKVIKTKKSDVMPQLHYDLKDETGKFKTMHWSVSHHPVLDSEGKVCAVFQATEDITEEVVREKQLERTEYQLSQALSNGLIGTWVWDVKQNKVFADENLMKLFGLPAESESTGLPIDVFMNVIHPDDRERVHVEIQKAVKARKLFECEYRIVNDEGVRWVIARGQVELDEKDDAVSFPGVVVDITERKTAEISLAFLTAASTQFAASLDPKVTLRTIAKMVVPNIADWCTIDLLEDGKIQRVATVHRDPSKVKWAEQLYEKQGPPDINETTGLPNVLRTGEVEYYPEISDEILVAAAKDDEEMLQLMRDVGFSSVIIVPMKIDGKVIGAISLISAESKIHYKENDIEVAKGLANRAALAVYNARLFQSAQRELEERRILQQKLEGANEALESRVAERTRQLVDTNDGLEKEIKRSQKIERELQKYSKSLARSNQELQDFAYVASHDLQEPLRKIQAFGDLLESEYRAQLGDGAEYLNRMRNAASRMSILIQDLLAFSRVSTKPQDFKQIDLNGIVKDVVGDLETRIAERGATVTIEKLPVVWADSTHMRQLFQNLIGNALKFHKPDVPPEVFVSVKSSAKDDKYYEIHVKDNGIGFDEKYLDRIFSVFQRLHGKDTYDGTGIGLAVCRKIVERYGGSIDAKSTPGAGSMFIIKLPINHKEQLHDD